MSIESPERPERVPPLPDPISQSREVPAKGPILNWRTQLIQPLVTVGLGALFSALETFLVRQRSREIALAQEARDNELHTRL